MTADGMRTTPPVPNTDRLREIIDARGNEDHTPEDYDDALAALDALVAELAEAKAKSRIDEQQCDDMTEAAIAAYGRAEAAELALDAAMTKLGNLSRIAAEEIERNPALGIPGYRKGALARAVLADKEGT